MKNKKGFTLIELLAVIVILGLLLAIAIPSVTRYITKSKKKSLVTSVNSYVGALIIEVNDMQYNFTDKNTIYAVPIECVSLERGGSNPFGEWMQANRKYFAYVLIMYEEEESTYKYGFTFKDSSGYGMNPIIIGNIDKDASQIVKNLDIEKPRSGTYRNLSEDEEVWKKSGFKTNEDTRLIVLTAATEGQTGDDVNTCTLFKKGSNYKEVEEQKSNEVTLKKATDTTNAILGKEIEKSKVEAIYTKDYIDIPSNAIHSWDVSGNTNGKVMAWTIDSDNNGLYELYIGQEGGVVAPSDSSYLFKDYVNVKTIDLKYFDTSNVTTMYHMFEKCSSLISLDLSNFNTRNVTNMSNMFRDCSSLESLDLRSFDTSNVTMMHYMFSNMTNLKTLDVSNFNTSKNKSMEYMFSSMKSLTSLDLSNFNTKNVTSMHYAFFGNSNLKELDISNFNTSNVTTMHRMFQNCSSLETLDVRSFNTSKVVDMYRMFSGMSALTSLNVSNFDTRNVTTMYNMFFGMENIQELDVSHFNTSNVTSMNGMFAGLSKVAHLNLSNFDTSNVTDMSYMFTGMTSLQELEIRNFNTKNVTNMESMFQSLKINSLDLSNFETINLTKANSMFRYMDNLKLLKLNKANYNNVKEFNDMFYYVPENVEIEVKDEINKKWIEDKLGVGNGTVVVKKINE